ncbi:MAG TPA: hypothetical protein VJ508_13800, partial [Saprospiraceae bacterium]|nr:hypothetical protein [Saprospiraceae bacterium]
MKNLLSIFAALFLMSNASFATVRTVSNHPLGGSQFATLDAAYNAAVNGDTLLLEGTNLIYTKASAWAKALVVIGQGINTSKTNFKKTII